MSVPGELAHFYVFREIFHGRKLFKTSENPERWEFTGDEILMPRTFPMATVPPGDWGTAGPSGPDLETRELLDAVNHSYSERCSGPWNRPGRPTCRPRGKSS